jgi:hypothetical protein
VLTRTTWCYRSVQLHTLTHYRSQIANATLAIASLLVEALAIQFPKLCAAIRDAISSLVEQLAEEVCTYTIHSILYTILYYTIVCAT